MATLAEIRQQFPQYDDMSDADLASALHSKHYSDMPKEEFDRRLGIASAPKKEATGNAAALLEGAAQGVTFGFSDEIEGGARALYGKLTGDQRPIGDIYGEAVAKPRQRIADAQDTNPWAYYSGEVGAGLAVPGGLARAGIQGPLARTVGQRLATRSWAAAKEGSAYGAAYGAGKSEGGPLNMAAGTALGAGTGAAVGFAIPGAVDIAGAVGQRISAPFRAYANPQQFAGSKFGEAITRDVPQGGAARFSDRVADMQAVNPSVRAMDAGSENIHSLMRSAANMPNEARASAKRFLDTRQANQHVRMTDDIERSIASPNTLSVAGLPAGAKRPTNFYSTIDDQVTKMEQIGQQQIQSSFARDTPMTPRLKNVFERPTMKELQGLVARKLADEDRPIGLMTRTEMIHRMKMELDDQIGMAARAERMGNKPQAGWDKRTLTILKRDLLNAVDNPQYKSGLTRYAGEARLKSAAEEGRDSFSKLAPEEITKRLKEFDTEAERQVFRMGAARAIVDQVRKGNANRDRTENVFGSPEMQKKLKALLPSPRQYRELQRSLVIEAKMADSRKALQGNSTTAKQLTEGAEAGKDAEAVIGAANALGGLVKGNFGPALQYAARGANRFSGITPPVANELLRLGLSKDPAVGNALAQSAILRARETAGQRASVGSAVASGAAASMDGQRQTVPLQIDLTYDQHGVYPDPRWQ
jgi:hypothetical protein